MLTKIKIHTDSTGWIAGEINDELNPTTANKIISALPISSSASLWGDEIYFDIPVSTKEEHSQIEVEIGDLAFWTAGSCFCIFFGRTPASRNDKPAAASAVNVFGRVMDDPTIFKKVHSGEIITVDLA